MSASRRFVAGLVRLGLVILAIVFIVRHFHHSGPKGGLGRMRVETEAPPPDSLGPGDLRIYNTDSAVDIILKGDKILAGLSPKTVGKVRADLGTSAAEDTSGLGASISKIVKTSVAGAIGTHAVWNLSDVRDVRYENGALIFDWTDGGTHEIFSNTHVNKGKVANTFRPEDAQRFVEAVRARKAAAGTPVKPK
jgi:hypothetical protein